MSIKKLRAMYMLLKLVDELCVVIQQMSAVIYEQAKVIEQSSIEDSVKKELEEIRSNSQEMYEKIIQTTEV